MRAVVTGAAGFIGRHTVPKLARLGYSVIAVDADEPAVEAARLGDVALPEGAGVSWVAQDIRDTDRMRELVTDADLVVHLAGSVLIRGGETDTRRDLEQIVIGTRSILEAVVAAGVPRICHASSAAVYGMDRGRPFTELDALHPISLYGAAKAAAEAFHAAYAHLFGVAVSIFRFGNVLGPGLHRGVVWDFVRRLRRDPTELVVLGDAQQRKSYVDVDDCVDGLVMLGVSAPPEGVSILNLSAPGMVTVQAIARRVLDRLAPQARIRPSGGRQGWPGDVPVLELDSSRAISLGWTPGRTAWQAVERAIDCAIEETSR